MNRRHSLRLIALAVIPVAAGCTRSGETGGGAAPAPTGPPTPSTGAGLVVTVENFSFEPAALTVPVGATVTWRFKDKAAHNAVADDKTFASPNLNSGQTFSHTFTTAGSYPYRCTLHQYMTAAITVQ